VEEAGGGGYNMAGAPESDGIAFGSGTNDLIRGLVIIQFVWSVPGEHQASGIRHQGPPWRKRLTPAMT
jgi:hypothetical protein